jgi:hypothetical protein
LPPAVIKKTRLSAILKRKKAIQEGMPKEKQIYEGVQKGVENLEKKMQEQETKK